MKFTHLWTQSDKTHLPFQLLRHTNIPLCKCTYIHRVTRRKALGSIKSTGGVCNTLAFSNAGPKLEFELAFL